MPNIILGFLLSILLVLTIIIASGIIRSNSKSQSYDSQGQAKLDYWNTFLKQEGFEGCYSWVGIRMWDDMMLNRSTPKTVREMATGYCHDQIRLMYSTMAQHKIQEIGFVGIH
jgi:hypothetical protein